MGFEYNVSGNESSGRAGSGGDAGGADRGNRPSCVYGARWYVKALISEAACSRSRCVMWPVGLDGGCGAEGKHLFVVLSFAACISPHIHLQWAIKRALTRRVTTVRQRTSRSIAPPPAFSLLFLLPGVSLLLFIPRWSPCWIVRSLTKPDPSLPARQLLSGTRRLRVAWWCFSGSTNAEKGEKFR